MATPTDSFKRFLDIIQTLRDPEKGCPWDLEQTHESLRPYMIEEAYELIEAIEDGDDTELCKELGDVLLQVILHSTIAQQRKSFDITDVIEAVSEKMIARHPHVFGDVTVSGTKDVVKNWEQIKYEERKNKKLSSDTQSPVSALSGVPSNLPGLLQAQRLGEKAARVSFDWSSIQGVWGKVQEEIKELEVELESAGNEPGKPNPAMKNALEHELGDVLFSLCQLARWLDVSAEDCLRIASKRFTQRFHAMEQSVGSDFDTLSEEKLEIAWQNVKKALD